MADYERRHIVGNAAATELTAPLTSDGVSISIDDATNWPDGSVGPFIVVINRGQPNEEKIRVTERSSTTLTVPESGGRGHDGTTASAHEAGAIIEVCLDATTIDQANRYVNLQAAKGDLVVHNGTNPVVLSAAGKDSSNDDETLVFDSGEATGWKISRLPTVTLDGSAPAVAGAVRLWYDQTHGVLRTSDGDAWLLPVAFPAVADDTARSALFGGSPKTGSACYRSDYGLAEIYNGVEWAPLGIPSFADVTARNSYYSSPFDGARAYTRATHEDWLYRNNEWILTSQEMTTSVDPPSSPQEGDLWFQPID